MSALQNPFLYKDDLLVYALAQMITANLRARYEEIKAFPEPVIERQHSTNSSIHETFRVIAPVTTFTSVVGNTSTSPVTALSERLAFGKDGNRPLLLFAHISPHHYAETMFAKDYVIGIRSCHGCLVHMTEFLNIAWDLVVVKVLSLRKSSNRFPSRSELRFQWLSKRSALCRCACVVISCWSTSPILPTQYFSTIWNFRKSNLKIVNKLA